MVDPSIKEEVIEVDQQLLREYNNCFSKMLAAGAYSTVSCFFFFQDKKFLTNLMKKTKRFYGKSKKTNLQIEESTKTTQKQNLRTGKYHQMSKSLSLNSNYSGVTFFRVSPSLERWNPPYVIVHRPEESPSLSCKEQLWQNVGKTPRRGVQVVFFFILLCKSQTLIFGNVVWRNGWGREH